MRNYGLFLTGLASIMLFSCSNNQESAHESGGPGGLGEPALLSVSLAGNEGVQGRATGTPTQIEESMVNDGIVYIFDAGGNVLNKAYFSAGDIAGSSGSKQIATTTAAASVSVLLNTGVTDSASMVGQPYDVPTKRQLEALTVNLAQPDGTGTQIKDHLLMSGSSTAPIVYSGSPKTADVPVTVSRIVSKIMMSWSFAPNSTFTNKIRLVGAVVLNASYSSSLFGVSLALPATQYVEGLPAEVLGAFPDGGYKPAFADMISNVGLMAVSNFMVAPVPDNHFYIFENANILTPTIVALVADYNENGIDVPAPENNLRKYYPVVINKAATGGQDGTMTIKRNVTYNVMITVKGVGVDNPFEPIDPASLNVTVTVADWALIVNVNQTFE